MVFFSGARACQTRFCAENVGVDFRSIGFSAEIGEKSWFFLVFLLDIHENCAPWLVNGFAWNPRENFGNFLKISKFFGFFGFWPFLAELCTQTWGVISGGDEKTGFPVNFAPTENHPPRLRTVLGQKWPKTKKIKKFRNLHKIFKIFAGVSRESVH